MDVDGPRYALEDVRGHANAEATPAMWQWAQRVEQEINAPHREVARRQALLHARDCARRVDTARSEWVRRFDRASRAELERVPAWLRMHREADPRGDVLLEDQVAGTGHTSAADHVDELIGGDSLDWCGNLRTPMTPRRSGSNGQAARSATCRDEAMPDLRGCWIAALRWMHG